MTSSQKVVVNSTPIIMLGNAGRIELLQDLFDLILVPEAVIREVMSKNDRASRYLARRHSWIHVMKPRATDEISLMPAKLHAGEIEVMLLARQVDADLVVMDDNAARRTAEFLSMNVTGTLGVLITAKSRGLIDAVAPCLDEMRRTGFRVSDAVVANVLDLAGE